MPSANMVAGQFDVRLHRLFHPFTACARPQLRPQPGLGMADRGRTSQHVQPRDLPPPPERVGVGCFGAAARLDFAAVFGGALPARRSAIVWRVVI